MANVILNNSEKYLTLEDCEIGDIVLLNKEIYLITNRVSNIFYLLHLKTVRQEEFYYDTICACYQKALNFDMSDFQVYLNQKKS